MLLFVTYTLQYTELNNIFTRKLIFLKLFYNSSIEQKQIVAFFSDASQNSRNKNKNWLYIVNQGNFFKFSGYRLGKVGGGQISLFKYLFLYKKWRVSRFQLDFFF